MPLAAYASFPVLGSCIIGVSASSDVEVLAMQDNSFDQGQNKQQIARAGKSTNRLIKELR